MNTTTGVVYPRSVQGGFTVGSGNLTVSSGNLSLSSSTAAIVIGARGNLTATADGVWMLRNDASTDFGRLLFGGTTSSFPALKRSSTVLQVRLADDSAFAGLTAGEIVSDERINLSSTGYIIGNERTDVGAPSANGFVIYARDTGGKTELVARFATGAIQRLAIEP